MAYSDAFQILAAPATQEDLATLTELVGSLPISYRTFLSTTDGADCALHQPEIALRLYSVADSIRCNVGYQIQVWLPRLWMMGDDHGDYAYCFDRGSSADPESWRIVEVAMGALFEDEMIAIAPSFREWQESLFLVRH